MIARRRAPRVPLAWRHAASGGFTLLELLVVMGVIGVLGGLGLGFLQRGGKELDVAVSMVRDQVRLAALTARTRRLPTAVLLDAGGAGRSPEVRARVLVPVAQWHMDEASRSDPRVVPDELNGTLEPGRFGMARRPREGKNLMSLETEPLLETLFQLDDGFALHVDVLLDERGSMTIVRYDANLTLTLDDALIPEVKMVLRDGREAGGSERLRGVLPLRLGHWTTLSIVHDREWFTLLVDGRIADQKPVGGIFYQGDGGTLEISPGDDPVRGLVDELRLLAYELTDPQVLPAGVELHSQFDRIAFDRDGNLVEPVRFEFVFGEERAQHSVEPGGIIR